MRRGVMRTATVDRRGMSMRIRSAGTTWEGMRDLISDGGDGWVWAWRGDGYRGL